jgi:hypothetical protein
MVIMLVRLALLLIALLAAGAAALAEPPKLFVVEVKYWKVGGGYASDFLLLEWRKGCKLELSPPRDALGVLVRVDAATPFKPSGVAVDGVAVVPKVDEGVIVVEDFAWINFTRLGFVPKTLSISFAEYAAKPPVYALNDKEGERVWGYLVSSLLRNTSVIDLLVGLKLTVTACEPINIPLSTGNVTLWSASFLAAAEALQPLIKQLQNAAVELRAVPLYYLTDVKKASSAMYIYANLPAGCQLELQGYTVADDALGRVFPSNPALLRALPGFKLATGACSFDVVNPGPYDYVVENNRVAAGRRATITISRSSGAVAATAYRRGVSAYNLSLYGYSPTVVLPVYSYSVLVDVVDAKGEPVNNATAFLIGVGSAVRDFAYVAKGSCVFEAVPPGEYLVSVLSGDREVGRAGLRVESGDAHLTVNTTLVDFEVTVVYPNGDRVAGYAVTLKDERAQYVSQEVDGKARFEDIPAGRYSYVISKGGVAIAGGVVNVDASSSSYVIVSNLTRVFVKIVDFFGRPIARALIEVKGPVELSARTGDDGTAALDLKPGLYEITVPELGLRSTLEVKGGGSYVALSFVPRELYLAVGALAVIAVAVAISRKRNTGIEVLELKE